MITGPVLATVLMVACATVHPADGATLRAEGLELGFNLDYDEALAVLERAIALDPSDATAHRLAAAVIWMRILFSQGAITAEDYLGQATPSVARPPAPAALAARFDRHIDRALSLSEKRVQASDADPDAHFQLGAALALRTTYIATVQGKVLDSLGAGKRAYREHTRALALDPARKDAALVPGMYRYTVGSLSLPMRWMARLAGFQGGRRAGLQLVEQAASHGGLAQTNARLALIVMYNRERRHDAALAIVRQLQLRFPRNRLFWLEAGSTALRAGRPGEALEAIDEGMRRFTADERSKAYGEEAQWRYQRAQALLDLGLAESARGELGRVLAANGPDWIRQRARALLTDKRAKGLD